ncbi:ubiquitin-conjugating enzyme/RWD-like protein, partial [Rhodotorula diobovata]
MAPQPARAKRLARELQECHRDDDIDVHPVGDSVDHFIGTFSGPQGTSYQGGRFDVDIVAPDRYPFEPLKIKFITKVYHPNISSASGFICLDILGKAWSPVYTLRTCLVSLQSLLSSPEPTDPQDAEVAKHYLTDRRGFEETARFWTESYAHPRPPSTTHTPAPAAGSTTSSPSTASASRPSSRSSSRSARRPPPPSAPTTEPDAPTPTPPTARDLSPSASPSDAPGPKTLARLAGLDWRDVQAFTDMGFPPERVIETLRFLNYRDGNRDRVGEEAV